MPDNLKNSEIELGAQVLETADMQRYSSSEPDNLEAIFSDVLTQLELRYGEDVTLLSDLGTKEATTPKDKAKTCEIVKAFYTLVLKLPDKTKVKTLRSIYSQM